ncbi:hypothetical protein DOTSEDRAFT_73150 [Dothistroma septosporum NZE10]|uniref:WIBG Mago-binding domain-containing protein n=1 Tax=Dothistroma septosporum (strain NZE10 / CBS 128990) TaxID=675120 RepID=N1PL12_DOTSN|nr:hypothetical protein DOTSEDRAFT_73150 [Dothistroma septosporum NZE10]
MADKVTKSGIKKLSNGKSVIPSSTRPDGSVRKEIRVKPGYKPPEDVEVYKNRIAEAWKNRGERGVPGAESAGSDHAADLKQSAAAAKNAKRREARKKAAAGGKEDGAENAMNGDKTADAPKPGAVEPEAETAKEAKKLAKKLRQARELKDKKDEGAALLPEQFAKVIKMSELIRQLDALGFDTDGEKKVDGDKDPGLKANEEESTKERGKIAG